MKVSLKQLKRALLQLEKETMYVDHSTDDSEVCITIVEGDPGNGKLLSHIVMTATGSELHNEKSGMLAVDAKVEVFEKVEKLEPIITVNLTKKLQPLR